VSFPIFFVLSIILLGLISFYERLGKMEKHLGNVEKQLEAILEAIEGLSHED
jgi:hypothetical protein